MSIFQIDRVSGLSLAEFNRHFVEPGLPVVLKDATKDWPAISKWTREYLESQAGVVSVKLRSIDPRKAADHTRFEEMTLRSYLQQVDLTKPDDPILAELPLKSVFPQLLSDIGSFPYSAGSADSLSIMVSSNSRAPLHYHTFTEAISHQITGFRRFLLFPPNETSKLDPRPPTGPLPNFGRRVFREDEAERAPERIFDAKLSPGEALYIPRHWWHTVFASGNLSVLLVHFFEYKHSACPHNEVTCRIELLRRATIEAISTYQSAFESSSTFEERCFYFQRLSPLFKVARDEDMENRFLSKAAEVFPQFSEERIRIEARLVELNAKPR